MKKRHIIVFLASVFLMTGVTLTHAYEVGEAHNGGTIHGQVTFSGNPPGPLRFTVEKNPEICGQERSLLKVETHNGFLTGAVVVLEGVKKGKPFPMQALRGNLPGEGEFRYQGGNSLGLQVKTKGCNFGPFTGVIAADEAVRFQNQDMIKHVLHSFVSKDTKGRILRTVHNQDLSPRDEIDRVFPSDKMKDGVVVRIICNRHDFMQNWLYVVDNPYFAISDQEGRFTIDEIQPGTYTLLVRHPVLGEQRQEVTIEARGDLQVGFQFVNE
ncbi:MAG: carboxypeptidase regulatory-like domain-containing protein [Nitrospirota bacterium]|nr:carboxypeptidase regulatory-like domain-containing protein [Nitrospirota bacterium]MDH4360949.1 carboxypeptidase regulatory-like domain-containing protein [Nitrospirota bacterium]